MRLVCLRRAFWCDNTAPNVKPRFFRYGTLSISEVRVALRNDPEWVDMTYGDDDAVQLLPNLVNRDKVVAKEAADTFVKQMTMKDETDTARSRSNALAAIQHAKQIARSGEADSAREDLQDKGNESAIDVLCFTKK